MREIKKMPFGRSAAFANQIMPYERSADGTPNLSAPRGEGGERKRAGWGNPARMKPNDQNS
jgi:hypothetical protein